MSIFRGADWPSHFGDVLFGLTEHAMLTVQFKRLPSDEVLLGSCSVDSLKLRASYKKDNNFVSSIQVM